MVSVINAKKKTSNDIKHIANYLLELNEFIHFLTKFNPNKQISLEERLNKIVIALKAEILEAKNIVYVTGMRGEKSYIILEGELAYLYAIDLKCYLTENEYSFYLFKLRVYEEFELLNRCLQINKNIVDINYNFLNYLTNEKLSFSDLNIEIFALKSEHHKEYKNVLNKAKLSKFNHDVNERDYIEKLSPNFSVKPSNSIPKHFMTIFKYKTISTKGKGEIFGNLVMDSSSSQRYYNPI